MLLALKSFYKVEDKPDNYTAETIKLILKGVENNIIGSLKKVSLIVKNILF